MRLYKFIKPNHFCSDYVVIGADSAEEAITMLIAHRAVYPRALPGSISEIAIEFFDGDCEELWADMLERSFTLEEVAITAGVRPGALETICESYERMIRKLKRYSNMPERRSVVYSKAMWNHLDELSEEVRTWLVNYIRATA